MQPRRLLVVRGSTEETRQAAAFLTSRLSQVLQLSGTAPARDWLGASVAAVILDLHDGVSADVLGQVHGSIHAGGVLILRLPADPAPLPSPGVCVAPWTLQDVGTRFWRRLIAALPAIVSEVPDAPFELEPWQAQGTAEQGAIVDRLVELIAQGQIVSLVADRGRGKSAALGLAVGKWSQRRAGLRVLVTAPSERAAAEVFRFANAPDGAASAELDYVAPDELLRDPPNTDLVVVDEAAQLPVPLLQRLVVCYPDTPLAFATTTHGYEGTGRGYVLRFSKWLASLPRVATALTLYEPIRWAKGDPLEAWVSRLLCVDAELAHSPEPTPPDNTFSHGAEPRVLTRDELAQDEQLLRSAFGLLVHAHYKTTPSDLQRLLDAPNLQVHAILDGRDVVAITLVAREGGLSVEHAADVATGRSRVRGHALPDTLSTHAAHPEAAQMSFIRSVRIATHPAFRKQGLARRLVATVEQSYDVDAFGTVFGATLELLRFRHSLGYQLVRLGGSRGPSTGQPAVVMLHARSERGRTLVASLRNELSLNLPLQLRLLENDGGVPLDPALQSLLLADLAPPRIKPPSELTRAVQRYVASPQPVEAAIFDLHHFIDAHPERLERLSAAQRTLVEGRVGHLQSWREVAARAGYPSVGAATRAIRGAFALLVGED